MLGKKAAIPVQLDWNIAMMHRCRKCFDLTFIPLDQSIPFVVRKNSVHSSDSVECSNIFLGSTFSNFKGFSSSHSWKQIVFRHVGSIWGRPPETNTKLILNN